MNDIVWFRGFNENSDWIYYIVETLKDDNEATTIFKSVINEMIPKLSTTNFGVDDKQKYIKKLEGMFTHSFLTKFYDTVIKYNKDVKLSTNNDPEKFIEWLDNKNAKPFFCKLLISAIMADYYSGSMEIDRYASPENKNILDKQSVARGKDKLSQVLKASQIKMTENIKMKELKQQRMSMDELKKLIKESIKNMALEDTIQEDTFMIWHKPLSYEIHVGDTVATKDAYGNFTKSGIVEEKENGFAKVNGTKYLLGELRIKKPASDD